MSNFQHVKKQPRFSTILQKSPKIRQKIVKKLLIKP